MPIALVTATAGLASLFQRTPALACSMTAREISLENKSGPAADYAVDCSVALRAFGNRHFTDGLLLLKLMAAGLTFVFVCWHVFSPRLDSAFRLISE